MIRRRPSEDQVRLLIPPLRSVICRTSCVLRLQTNTSCRGWLPVLDAFVQEAVKASISLSGDHTGMLLEQLWPAEIGGATGSSRPGVDTDPTSKTVPPAPVDHAIPEGGTDHAICSPSS